LRTSAPPPQNPRRRRPRASRARPPASRPGCGPGPTVRSATLAAVRVPGRARVAGGAATIGGSAPDARRSGRPTACATVTGEIQDTARSTEIRGLDREGHAGQASATTSAAVASPGHQAIVPGGGPPGDAAGDGGRQTARRQPRQGVPRPGGFGPGWVGEREVLVVDQVEVRPAGQIDRASRDPRTSTSAQPAVRSRLVPPEVVRAHREHLRPRRVSRPATRRAAASGSRVSRSVPAVVQPGPPRQAPRGRAPLGRGQLRRSGPAAWCLPHAVARAKVRPSSR